MNPETNPSSVWNELRLAYQILRDPETPIYLKGMPLLAMLYFVVPEGWLFFPLGTPIDDIAILYLAVKGFINFAPPQIVARHQKALGLDVLEGEYEIVENEASDKEIDASIVLNPDK